MRSAPADGTHVWPTHPLQQLTVVLAIDLVWPAHLPVLREHEPTPIGPGVWLFFRTREHQAPHDAWGGDILPHPPTAPWRPTLMPHRSRWAVATRRRWQHVIGDREATATRLRVLIEADCVFSEPSWCTPTAHGVRITTATTGRTIGLAAAARLTYDTAPPPSAAQWTPNAPGAATREIARDDTLWLAPDELESFGIRCLYHGPQAAFPSSER